mmetsp:Transcript_6688/g.5814  ORF Transcript_6688/g.5814 Transcript_6688/m.5814 type:complete len:280 (+) Transcript_6688:2-841(+)
MSWHYIKNITRKPRILFPKNVVGTNSKLAEFTNNVDERQGGAVTGRSWRANELRLKSNNDLHKLWYVLLKEKNRLLGDRLLSIQLNQQYEVHNNMKKVRLSMSRLLTIVNERKSLREKYRAYLEGQYIQEKKNEEIRARLEEQGRNMKDYENMEPQFIHEAKKQRAEFKAKKEQINEDYKQRLEQKLSSEKQTVLDDRDIKLLALNDTQMRRKDVVKMHVKNIGELGEKARRQVYEKIQNQRSMHARKIFLKELNMIGWQFKNKTANPNPAKANLEEMN